MLGLLRLIRIRTLGFAALTMYTMRYFVILPMLELNGFSLQMAEWAFGLLVFAVCCLISAAYIINDYFDMRPDKISGVKDVVIGKTVSRRTAITMHTVLNLLAVVIAFYLGIAVGVWKIGILFVLISGLLWFYSSVYKKYFIVGNVIVGVLSALIPVSTIIYEIPLLNVAYANILLETNTNFMYMFYWVFGFSWFIFLNTLMYEINKDIYTLEGDRENGINTLPVQIGVVSTCNIINILTLIALLSVVLIYRIEFWHDLYILAYLFIAVVLPYGLYFWAINRRRLRCLQLNLIRGLMVTCIGVAFFLRHFFEYLLAD